VSQQAPTVNCDKCSKPFTIELKERPVSGGGAEQRFRCPHCRTWFYVAYITAEGIRIRRQIKQVETQIQQRPDDAGLREQLMALRQRMRAEVRGPNER
jgi:predicted Zn finger-like uncharacterized protein